MLSKTMYDNLIDHCSCTVAFTFSALFFPSALPPSAAHRASAFDARVTARFGVSSSCSRASVAPDLVRFNTREGSMPLLPLSGRCYLLCLRCGGCACENKDLPGVNMKSSTRNCVPLGCHRCWALLMDSVHPNQGSGIQVPSLRIQGKQLVNKRAAELRGGLTTGSSGNTINGTNC
jgi:hypothetical protein